jgi:hypothetical protein
MKHPILIHKQTEIYFLSWRNITISKTVNFNLLAKVWGEYNLFLLG